MENWPTTKFLFIRVTQRRNVHLKNYSTLAYVHVRQRFVMWGENHRLTTHLWSDIRLCNRCNFFVFLR